MSDMKYFCEKCCIEFEEAELSSGCLCPNCDTNLQFIQEHEILYTSAIDTINKYEKLINVIYNEVYPFIQGLYYPKYIEYEIKKVKIVYAGNFVLKPAFKLKLENKITCHRYKSFQFFAEILDTDWKVELKKIYDLKIEKIKRQMEQKIEIDKKIAINETISSRILSYKIMNNLIESFKNNPLTEEEQKYLKYQTEIPNEATIEAIKELERR